MINRTRVDWAPVGAAHKAAMYVIANQFGHRVINSAEMDELMTESSSPEEFDRLCDQAIGRNN